MMKKQNLFGVVAFGLLLAAPAFAQGDGERAQPRRDHMLEKLDTNEDGAIDEAEFMVMGAERFQKADLNGDGSVTAEEAEQAAITAMEARMQKRVARKVAKHMERLDTDGDGRISREESEAAAKKRFANADRNDDGVLTREDRQRGKGKRGRQHRKHKKQMDQDNK